MEDEFRIYVEQLRDGQEKVIHETFEPEFLDINEDELAFEVPVKLDGVAYTAENELILNWNIKTEAVVNCSICNEKVSVPIEVNNFYYGEPLEDIKTGIFNFKELLRETILLEVPPFSECNQGHCPSRKELAPFFKEASEEGVDEEDGYQPFADIDWKL